MDELDMILASEIENKRRIMEGPGGSYSNNDKNSGSSSSRNGEENVGIHVFVKRRELEELRRQTYFEEQKQLEREREGRRQKKLQEMELFRQKAAPSKHSQSSSSTTTWYDYPPVTRNGIESPLSTTTRIPQEITTLIVNKESTHVSSISNEEVIRRLRARRQPIRLFGETDERRIHRLRTIESIEHEGEGQRNDFMRTVAKLDVTLDLEALRRRKADSSEDRDTLTTSVGNSNRSTIPNQYDTIHLMNPPCNKDDDDADKEKSATAHGPPHQSPTSSKVKEDKNPMNQVLLNMPISAKMMLGDRSFLCRLIRHYLKRLISEWQEELDARPDLVKRSTQGKLVAATLHQTNDYIQPLFVMLKDRTIPDDILQHVATICELMQQREYVKASDCYYLLSIGNAPWPIGVTMVGIHERSAREKISSSQVAHVLNDERQRKWIQSLKRLMTFSQKRYPPEDPSKCV
jgi:pre-mRNA-splicing factor 18